MNYTIEKVDIKDKMSGDKNGKKWSFTPIGIRINGNWHNGIINDDADLEQFKEGATVNVILFEKEGTGKYAGKMFPSFKLPKKDDILNERLDKAAKVIAEMAEQIKKLTDRIGDQEKQLNVLYNNKKIKELLMFN